MDNWETEHLLTGGFKAVSSTVLGGANTDTNDDGYSSRCTKLGIPTTHLWPN